MLSRRDSSSQKLLRPPRNAVEVTSRILPSAMLLWALRNATVNAVMPGNIATEGNFANGIVAQSIGGGGGTNGSRIVDEYGLVNPLGTSTTTLRGRSSASGDGGAVTVENSANITTQGGFAHGIRRGGKEG